MIARASEVGAIERFAATAAERAAVLVLEGEPGIGKTTLWEAGIELARGYDMRILTARPSGAET